MSNEVEQIFARIETLERILNPDLEEANVSGSVAVTTADLQAIFWAAFSLGRSSSALLDEMNELANASARYEERSVKRSRGRPPKPLGEDVDTRRAICVLFFNDMWQRRTGRSLTVPKAIPLIRAVAAALPPDSAFLSGAVELFPTMENTGLYSSVSRGRAVLRSIHGENWADIDQVLRA